MNSLLIVTAVIELGAGLALVALPSETAELLLGSALDGHAAQTVGRVAGVALISLAVACWLARNDGQSRAANGLVAAMLLYNLGAVAILLFAGVGWKLRGVGLWLGVLLHAAMAAWCGACLWHTRVNGTMHRDL